MNSLCLAAVLELLPHKGLSNSEGIHFFVIEKLTSESNNTLILKIDSILVCTYSSMILQAYIENKSLTGGLTSREYFSNVVRIGKTPLCHVPDRSTPSENIIGGHSFMLQES